MTVLCRVSFLKKAVDQRNKAITSLNEAMNVSCALLSSQEGDRPISCTITTSWSHLELRDMLMATCTLENSSSFSLDQGWTLCIQVLTSSSALDLDGTGSAFTYTIPVDRLGPGSRREVTLPLGPTESGVLDLPVTMSCWLFYSLREVVGGALAPSDPLEVPYLEKLPLNLPKQEGVCLPLCKRTVDMLQCLRFPGVASHPAQTPRGPPGPACEPVETFLKTRQAPGSEPTGAASLRAKYLPPSTASLRVSAGLLRAALHDSRSGWWHSWLHFGCGSRCSFLSSWLKSSTAPRLLLDLMSCSPVMVLCVFPKKCEVAHPKQRQRSPGSSLVSSHTPGAPDQKPPEFCCSTGPGFCSHCVESFVLFGAASVAGVLVVGTSVRLPVDVGLTLWFQCAGAACPVCAARTLLCGSQGCLRPRSTISSRSPSLPASCVTCLASYLYKGSEHLGGTGEGALGGSRAGARAAAGTSLLQVSTCAVLPCSGSLPRTLLWML